MSMISNQINALRSVAQAAKIEGHEMYANHLEAAGETIEELAKKNHTLNMERSSAHYNRGWVPCSDRLPDTGDMYLTTMEKVDNCKVSVYENYFSFSDGWESEEFGEYKVIAWMPLPEPYKEVEDNE